MARQKCKSWEGKDRKKINHAVFTAAAQGIIGTWVCSGFYADEIKIMLFPKKNISSSEMHMILKSNSNNGYQRRL